MRIAGHTQAPSSRAATFYASRTLLNRNLQIDVLRERYDKQIKLHINVQIINYLHLSTVSLKMVFWNDFPLAPRLQK